MKRQIVAVLAAFGLLAQNAAQAAPFNNVPITWEELSNVIVEQRIGVTLPDGARLEGEALAVRTESLVMDVEKTSQKKLHPKGQTEIPRASVGEVRVIRMRGPAMRIVGGILGAVGGTGLAGVLCLASEAWLLPGVLIVVPLSAVAGYYAGKLADRRTTRLAIQPEGAAATPEEE